MESPRAAQKLNLSLPQWRKRDSYCDDGGVGFSGVLHRTPPVVPPALLRRLGVKEVSGVGKVKVMLRVCGASGDPGQGQGGQEATSDLETSEGATKSSSFFNVDTRRKQVTLFDPAACGGSSAPEDRRVGVAAPKMFAFDALFTQDDPQTEVCSSALTDVINAVINGNDGCLFCYGHAKLGKTHTMVGTPDAPGVIPCAISWLFRGINEQKQKTGARFSVRVSAVEVAGAAQNLRDLLAGHANDSEQSPGVYLRDDPLFGTQLQNQSELRVPTADKAAFYLDAALSSRSVDEGHLLYTLHVYQYSVAGKGGVAGGRSRLHLIDLASCDRGKASGGIPLSGIGNVLLAIFNGQKHLPYREHKLTQLLKECLSSLTCHAAMIAHVSPYVQHYTDTLATVQLASRIHRMRRRKIKFIGGSAGSSGSSGEEARLYENGRSTGSSDVDPSSSEQSADTVIYVGPSDDATDGEHPPVYIPSLNSGDNRCAMNKALRGSGAEHRPRHKPSTPHKLSNGSAEGSPTHRSSKISSVNGKPQISSTKSPVRTLKSSSKVTPVKEQDLQTVSPSKIPVPNGPVSGSDEQWIDGPRISKSKVAEARNLSKKKETWIDGPLQATKTVLGNGHASGVYGFMDSHKKSMIRKWVENQSVQSPRTASIKHLTTQRPPTTGGPASQQPYKELTVFKTCKDDEEDKTEPVQHKSEELAQRLEEFDEEERGVDKVNDTDNFCDKEKLDEEDEEGLGDIPPPLQLLHPQSKEMTLDVTKDNYDVRLHLLHGRHRMDLEGEEDDEMDEVLEIIEVEETMEQVPMQDSCLQVTEEDIAFCMGEMENPLPEVDQESTEEHPLRILSQENLTVVSTFADSISVTSEGRHRYSLYEQEDRFQQLARLHEMYKTKLAKASATPFRQPPSRCQSLSLSDMLYGEGCNDMCNSSIYSEPAFAYRDKICDNCKMSIRPRGGNSVWYKPSACNISSLRHPDGASNPNLKEEIERVPGNGASLSDHEEEAAKRREKGHKHTMDHLSNCQEDVRTVTGKAEDDDDDMLVLPPPLPAPVSSRLHARFFGKSSPQRLKETTSPSRGHQELNHSPKGFGYESAYKLKDANLASPGLRMQKKPEYKISPSHKIISPSHKSLKEVPCSLRHKDMSFISPSSRNLKESTLDLPSRHQRLSSPAHRGLKGGESGSPRCESSGYESVIRDSVSECSSLASSREFDNPPPDPAPPVPVLQYCREDVERLERRWTEVRGGRIKELQAEQQALKIELAAAKQRLLIPADRWSYELHVEGSMDFRDPSFVEALEKETHILKKRVVACKSHILMVTCFDTVSAAVDVD